MHERERQHFSQNGEDGILDSILTLIEPVSRYAVEFGAGDGIVLSNTAYLLREKGWRGLLIEQDAGRFERLVANYRRCDDIATVIARVLPDNVETIFAAAGVPAEFDLLSIDIDSNDYHVWKAIDRYRPRVVVIEYNASYPPPQRFVMPFDPDYVWDGSDNFGASLQCLHELGRSKGYELIYCESSGTNAFFVNRQYNRLFEIEDQRPETLYRLPMYGIPGRGRAPNGLGHPVITDRRLAEQAAARLEAILPRGETVILVDEEQWGGGAAMVGCRRLPFLQRDGQYWGPPPDDVTAIAALEQMRSAAGATFFVVAWPAFWWLDYYAGFDRYLSEQFRCIWRDDRLVVFDLRAEK